MIYVHILNYWLMKYLKINVRLIKKRMKACSHSLFQEHGMLSATASLGLIHMWDIDGGLVPIDKLVSKL